MEKYTYFEKDVSLFLKKGGCSIPMFFLRFWVEKQGNMNQDFFFFSPSRFFFGDFPAIAMFVNSGVYPNLLVSKKHSTLKLRSL